MDGQSEIDRGKFNLIAWKLPPKSSTECFTACMKVDQSIRPHCEIHSALPGMRFAPFSAHRFHSLAFADLDAGLAQNLPNFFMLAARGQFGFMIQIFRP